MLKITDWFPSVQGKLAFSLKVHQGGSFDFAPHVLKSPRLDKTGTSWHLWPLPALGRNQAAISETDVIASLPTMIGKTSSPYRVVFGYHRRLNMADRWSAR